MQRTGLNIFFLVIFLALAGGQAFAEDGTGADGATDQSGADGASDENVAAPGASELPPRHSIVYDNLLAARLNPLGLENRFNLGYRLRLWDNPGILFRDAYLGLTFSPTLSPAVTRIGGKLEFKPLAVLLMTAGAYYVSWFGTFQYMASFPSAYDNHSETELDVLKDNGENYSTGGFEAELQVQALAKVWQIVFRNDLHMFYDNMDLRAGDRAFYNVRIDAMVGDEGWSLTNDTDLIWLSDFGLVVGVRGTLTHAFYDESDVAATEDPEDNPNTPSFRIGPLLAYIIADDLDPSWNRPTVLAIVNWWIEHPYRTGEDVSQAVPYVVLGFRFQGDLWTSH